jgi:hypothetical protein
MAHHIMLKVGDQECKNNLVLLYQKMITSLWKYNREL